MPLFVYAIGTLLHSDMKQIFRMFILGVGSLPVIKPLVALITIAAYRNAILSLICTRSRVLKSIEI